MNRSHLLHGRCLHGKVRIDYPGYTTHTKKNVDQLKLTELLIFYLENLQAAVFISKVKIILCCIYFSCVDCVDFRK